MNEIKKLVLISFMLMFFSSFIFASTTCSNLSTTECDVCASYDGTTPIQNINIFKSTCVGNNCDFNFVSTTSNTLLFDNKNLVFKTSNCGSKLVNVNSLINLNFEKTIPTSVNKLFIKNASAQNKIHSLTLVGKNIMFHSSILDPNYTPESSALDITDINLIKLTKNSYIDVNEETNPRCNPGIDFYYTYGVKLEFNYIEISEDANSYIKIKSGKTYQGSCYYLMQGYPAALVGEGLINNSNDFNMFIIGGDSSDGYTPGGTGDVQGGTALSGGTATIYLNNFSNNGLANLEIRGGFGGNGGTGQEASGVNEPVGNGGWGGVGGNVIYKINNLENNIDANFNVNLISGNGGKGGDSGFDHGGPNQTDYAAAESGNNGGTIYFGLLNSWPQLIYSDSLKMVTIKEY